MREVDTFGYNKLGSIDGFQVVVPPLQADISYEVVNDVDISEDKKLVCTNGLGIDMKGKTKRGYGVGDRVKVVKTELVMGEGLCNVLNAKGG